MVVDVRVDVGAGVKADVGAAAGAAVVSAAGFHVVLHQGLLQGKDWLPCGALGGRVAPRD